MHVVFDWLIDWSVDWLIDWSVDWLIDWLIGRLIDWLVDWLIDWLVDWLIDLPLQPGPKYVWIPVAIRVLFIPFFLFCNYIPLGRERIIGAWVTNDYDVVYAVGGMLLALSSGYFSSLTMMFASRWDIRLTFLGIFQFLSCFLGKNFVAVSYFFSIFQFFIFFSKFIIEPIFAFIIERFSDWAIACLIDSIDWWISYFQINNKRINSAFDWLIDWLIDWLFGI